MEITILIFVIGALAWLTAIVILSCYIWRQISNKNNLSTARNVRRICNCRNCTAHGHGQRPRATRGWPFKKEAIHHPPDIILHPATHSAETGACLGTYSGYYNTNNVCVAGTATGTCDMGSGGGWSSGGCNSGGGGGGSGFSTFGYS